MRRYVSAVFTLALALALFEVSCSDPVEIPKPRAFPRVIYPEKQWTVFSEKGCPFEFEAPTYAKVERDTTFFDREAGSDCWFNLSVPALNAKIFCSYYPIASRADFDKFVSDAFAMTNKHTIKANYIDEIPIHRPEDRVHGLVFAVEGPAASSYQFFLTDSTRHFLRGALYFETQSRPDSLAPVIEFMRADLEKLTGTLRWR